MILSKNKTNSPRRKIYKKDQRLENAKTKWLPTATAKSLPKSYSKWYGVDMRCAINELEILGYIFSDEFKQQVNSNVENRGKEKRRRKEKRESAYDISFDQDEAFSFIAGYTENGAPFGITYEKEEVLSSKMVSSFKIDGKNE